MRSKGGAAAITDSFPKEQRDPACWTWRKVTTEHLDKL